MRRVLIIELEGFLRSLLAQCFEQSGFEVVAAASLEQGQRLAERFPTDLIIVDLEEALGRQPEGEREAAQGAALCEVIPWHVARALTLSCGAERLRSLRRTGAPIIYLAPKGGEVPFPSLCKPFRPNQLLTLAQLSLQLHWANNKHWADNNQTNNNQATNNRANNIGIVPIS